ncbi:hypothetical protein EYC84_008054 [Monilinia fructicola]|uniref:Uncharacterized protein n=1 Tax=Monilinia fructicola TaxID=38448 RepID=A0A5M9JHY5_MONFR|nr:hypothetical protein EYC84_008054 [Monilinia fructicola]
MGRICFSSSTRARFNAGPTVREKNSALAYLAVPVAPKSTAAVEKVCSWTSNESKNAKRTARCLARAKPWGPTLGGMLGSDSIPSTGLFTIIPVAPASERTEQTFYDEALDYVNYKTSNTKRIWFG